MKESLMTANAAYQAIIATPLGRVGIRMADAAVSALDYLPAATPEQPPTDAVAAAVAAQLEAYFHDPGYRFTVALALTGTAFQQRVWNALQTIPPGAALTYGDDVAGKTAT